MKQMIVQYIKNELGIDDEECLNSFLESYQETLQQELSNAKEKLAVGDFSTLRVAAHTLKGCSANIGAEPIRAKSLELENAAKASDAQTAKQALSDLLLLQETFLKE